MSFISYPTVVTHKDSEQTDVEQGKISKFPPGLKMFL